MIDCIHAKSQTSEYVDCACNRLLPLPSPGRTVRRRIAVCLKPCPYRNRENRTGEETQPRSAAAPDLTPADFPCIHRGDAIEMRECQLCGSRGKLFDVHACAVHGECSVQTRERGLQACVACEDQRTD